MCIEDAIRGIMSVVKSKTSNVTVNFGTGKPLTINEVVKRIGNVCGVGDPVILHGGEVYEYNKFYMSPRDMINKFSFEPRITLEDGIKKFSNFLIKSKEI